MLATLSFSAASALALSMNKGPRRPPDLLPALEPISPSFCERHGALVLVGFLVVVAAIGFGYWWLRRPKVTAVPHPEEEARQALRALVSKAEDTTLAGEVARQLRKFALAMLGNAGAERTTDELEPMLKRHPQIGRDVACDVVALLHECEARAFAAVPPPGAAGLAERALSLAGRLESALRPPAPVPATTPAQSQTAAT
jgi:hypothetical protein